MTERPLTSCRGCPLVKYNADMGTIRFEESWLRERGRAMRAELDAAPQDEQTRDAVIMRHLQAAMVERGIDSADDASWSELLGGLERAAAEATP